MYMFFHILLLIIIISYIKAEIPSIPYSTSNSNEFFLRNLDGKNKILFGRINNNECRILDINSLNNTAEITSKFNCDVIFSRTNTYNPSVDYVNNEIYVYSVNAPQFKAVKLTNINGATPSLNELQTQMFNSGTNVILVRLNDLSVLCVFRDSNHNVQLKFYNLYNEQSPSSTVYTKKSIHLDSGAIVSALKLSNNHILIIDYYSNKLGYSFVTDVDIWNYLIQVKWIKSKNLYLCDVVHDIFNADNTGIIEYAKDRIE